MPDGDGQTFRHPVVRRALREAISAVMRESLHQAAAGAPAADGPPERGAAQLLTALFLLDRNEDLVTAAQRALASPRDLSHAADASWHLAHALDLSGRREEASLVLARVLSRRLTLRPLDTVVYARLQALRAVVEAEAGQLAAEAHAREAISEATRAEDRLALGYALHALSLTAAAQGSYQIALELADQAIEQTSADGETAGLRLRVLSAKIALLDELGDRAGAGQDLAEAGTRVKMAREAAASREPP